MNNLADLTCFFDHGLLICDHMGKGGIGGEMGEKGQMLENKRKLSEGKISGSACGTFRRKWNKKSWSANGGRKDNEQ
jgi:hypothetical protein